MITVNKTEKRIDITNENYEGVVLIVDGNEYRVPLNEGNGFIANVDEEMNEVIGYGMTKLTVENIL